MAVLNQGRSSFSDGSRSWWRALCRAGSGLEECQQGWSKLCLKVLNKGCRQCLTGGEDQLGCQEGVFSTTLYRIGIPISEGFHACLEQTWRCCYGIPACMQLQQPDWLTGRGWRKRRLFLVLRFQEFTWHPQNTWDWWFTLNGPQNITKTKVPVL